MSFDPARLLKRSVRDSLVGAAIGLAFAFLTVELSGHLAALAMPSWYLAAALRYPVFLFQVWFLIVLGVPVALAAALCGYLLSRLTRSAELSPPIVALAVWSLYWLVSPLDNIDLTPLARLSFWTNFTPWACLVSVGLLFGYHVAVRQRVSVDSP